MSEHRSERQRAGRHSERKTNFGDERLREEPGSE